MRGCEPWQIENKLCVGVSRDKWRKSIACVKRRDHVARVANEGLEFCLKSVSLGCFGSRRLLCSPAPNEYHNRRIKYTIIYLYIRVTRFSSIFSGCTLQLNFNIAVSNFNPQFRSNTLRKSMNPLIFPSILSQGWYNNNKRNPNERVFFMLEKKMIIIEINYNE